ncbi:hypothetical protein KJ562_02055 [Patescibacteria group bacterium]|nr:hypothetical protein [Patescibacteria group bacterium]MBU4162247.1 hypothetical protein [Patescibacteria group bacterium]
MISNSQKGATLYFAIIIMSILLAAVFSISSIVLTQIRTIKGMGDSIIAFYAADTGIETALYDLYNANYIGHYGPVSLGSGTYTYEVWVTQPVGGALPTEILEDINCTAGEYYCIKSVGTYNNTKRAIEADG